jgi:hypothetical protein
MSQKNLDLVKKNLRLNWVPNGLGWIWLTVVSLITFRYTKVILTDLFDIFGIYDWESPMINILVFVFVFYGSYRFLQHTINKTL